MLNLLVRVFTFVRDDENHKICRRLQFVWPRVCVLAFLMESDSGPSDLWMWKQSNASQFFLSTHQHKPQYYFWVQSSSTQLHQTASTIPLYAYRSH